MSLMKYCKKAPLWFHTGQLLVYGQKQKQLRNEVTYNWLYGPTFVRS